MKKILSILALFACGVFAAQAQVDKTLQFVDKDGKVVENGAELTLTEVEAPWGDDQIVLPLSVKNTKNAKAGVRLIFNVMQIDTAPSKFVSLQNVLLTAKQKSILQNPARWMPAK